MKTSDRNKLKRSNKRFFICISICLVLSAVFFGKLFIGQYNHLNNLNGQIAQQLEKEKNIKADIVALQKEYEKKDSLEFVESVARKKLGMVKAREIVVVDTQKAKETLEKRNTPQPKLTENKVD